jgi:hypothetical protein
MASFGCIDTVKPDVGDQFAVSLLLMHGPIVQGTFPEFIPAL